MIERKLETRRKSTAIVRHNLDNLHRCVSVLYISYCRLASKIETCTNITTCFFLNLFFIILMLTVGR